MVAKCIIYLLLLKIIEIASECKFKVEIIPPKILLNTYTSKSAHNCIPKWNFHINRYLENWLYCKFHHEKYLLIFIYSESTYWKPPFLVSPTVNSGKKVLPTGHFDKKQLNKQIILKNNSTKRKESRAERVEWPKWERKRYNFFPS